MKQVTKIQLTWHPLNLILLIRLTLALAMQRYIYVCHADTARVWCTLGKTKKAIAWIFFFAVLHQMTRSDFYLHQMTRSYLHLHQMTRSYLHLHQMTMSNLDLHQITRLAVVFISCFASHDDDMVRSTLLKTREWRWNWFLGAVCKNTVWNLNRRFGSGFGLESELESGQRSIRVRTGII